MRQTNRILILVAVVAIALAAGIASAQDKGRRGGGGGAGATNAVTIAANEAVQKELGISADLAAKLATLRDDYRAAVQKEYQTAGINPQDFQNLAAEQRQKMIEIAAKLNAEFNPKVKDLVATDPFKRLRQIELQANFRNLGPGALLTSDVAAELKLTDDQKKTLADLNTEFGRKQRELFTGGGGGGGDAFTKLREERTAKTMEVLNVEQKEKLKALQGNTFDVSQLGGGRRGKGN
ncbi:MAG TPA: hypothetical protein VKH44_02420 [Pirellulaceae bacterium]|nr:hypothetical protein [Pirellulaceae bacterium]